MAVGAMLGAWTVSSLGPRADSGLSGAAREGLTTAGSLETVPAPGDAPVAQSTPEAFIANLAVDAGSGPEDGAAPAVTPQTAETLQFWRDLQSDLTRLKERVVALEQVLEHMQHGDAGSTSADADDPQSGSPPTPVDTQEQRHHALISAGLTEDWAADIVWRQSQVELQRLELRDQALREGWFNSERYREALRDLQRERPLLRGEIGDEAYDRYLYAMGQSNRVLVDSVIQGSPAEQAGLQSGDVILSYAEERLFQWTDLRSASSAGERGEIVMVDVQRGPQRFQVAMPRGPLGVRLDAESVEPLP